MKTLTPAQSNPKKPWADGPFPLVTTPAFSTGDYTEDFNACATHMALVHNVILRTLNSIYLQAPNVLPEDITAFIGYCQCWSAFLHVHHDGEESHFFENIAQATGDKNVMQSNVEQHKLFATGLAEFDAYLKSILKSPESFSGARLNGIIDEFGPSLSQHLTDEIPTILNLREYGKEKVPIKKISADEAKHSMGGADKKRVLALFVMNLDLTFEGGIHKSFPPVPWIAWVMLKWVFTWPNRKYWKFSSCDRHGNPRELYAAKEISEPLQEVMEGEYDDVEGTRIRTDNPAV
ncbi:hypothetical protein RUND412_001831 [Rhizina undulata]